MKVAKDRKSSVLASNAVHHRVDSLTSIVALLAIGGSHVLKGAAWLDPVGGLIVSTMVIQAGFGNTKAAIAELCDKGVDDEIKNSVAEAARQAVESSEVKIGMIQGIKAGQNYLMEIQVSTPADWTLEQLQEVERAVRERVGSKVRGARRIKVQFVAATEKTANFTDEFVDPDVSIRSTPEPEAGENHHHHHDEYDPSKHPQHGKTNKDGSLRKR